MDLQTRKLKPFSQEELIDRIKESEITLTEEQYKLIDKRKKAHLEDKGKSFAWEETKNNAIIQ